MFVQVVEQGLTPGMALGACKLPDSDSSKLSRKITEAVDTVARAELALESTMKSAVSSKNTNHDEEPSKKRRRSSSSSAASAAAASAKTISPVPLPLPSSAPAQKPPPDLVSSNPHISNFHDQFTAPYLQNGRKKGSHFRKKVELRKEELRKEGTIVTPIVPKKNTVKKTRKTTKQKHTEWVNEKSATDDHETRFRDAAQEAISILSAKKQGKGPQGSKEAILDDLNKRYSLDGEGRDGSREKGEADSQKDA